MSVVISDEILQASQLTPGEFRQEIALHLFNTGCLTLGYASKLADIPLNAFRQLLKQRNIPLYSYDVEDFELDLKNLRELGTIVIVISDTSVITNLAAIDHLQLLPQLYNQVTLPEAVYRELTDMDTPVPETIEVQMASVLEVRQVVNRQVVERLRYEVRLDPGESEAIALALELDADLLLIDERRGRAEANRLGVRITGLLGILVEAKRKNLIVSVKPLMDDLIAASQFRVSSPLYNQILNMVDETIRI